MKQRRWKRVRATGSDTVEGTEERVIRAMPIVTTLSFVRAVKDKA